MPGRLRLHAASGCWLPDGLMPVVVYMCAYVAGNQISQGNTEQAHTREV